MALRRRSQTFYRAVLALPVVALVYLIVSGRGGAYWHLFSSAASGEVPLTPEAMMPAFVTGLIWLAAVSPLAYASWEIGREHAAARRGDYAALVGLREVVRRALHAPDVVADREVEASFARPPRDRPGVALAWGVAIAVLLPTFFASFLPELRAPGALAWLAGAGVIMGGGAYCRQRSMAYLLDEPGRFDVVREWRLLNPGRYDEPGRAFVRWRVALTVLLPVWWLGGGSLVLFKG